MHSSRIPADGGWYVEDVPLVELMYLVVTRMPGESYLRRLMSLLYLCYVFRTLINSLVCWFGKFTSCDRINLKMAME